MIVIHEAAAKLKPGQAINLSREQIHEAAEQNLGSLIFDGVLPSDMKEIQRIVNEEWDGFMLAFNEMDCTATLYRQRY